MLSMLQRAAFIELVGALVDLYPDRRSAQRLATDVGLDVGAIDFSGPARLFMANLLDQTDRQGKVPLLIDRALAEYPSHAELRQLRNQVLHHEKGLGSTAAGSLSAHREAIQQLSAQLTEYRANLALIDERRSEYVLTTDVPLQLVREERRLRERITQVEAQLAELVARSVRWTLRPPVADFTGRAGEADALVSGLRDGGCAVICGMGGSGKTELALVVAQALATDFPDAGLMIELQPGAAPLAPPALLAQIIRPFRPDARLGDDLDSLLALYRALLAGQRGLLLLDNAAGAAQVQPLLPLPAGWAVLVTARSCFELPGATLYHLDRLAPQDSVALLARLLADGGRGDLVQGDLAQSHLRELADACGGLPLVIRIAASHLGTYRERSLPDYLAALAADRLASLTAPGRPSLAAVLRLSLDRLRLDDPVLAGRWYDLAVFPAPFDQAAAAAVWDVTGSEAGDSLRGLVQQSLLEYDDERELYALHPLLADLAREHPVTDELCFRHAEHYLVRGRDAESLYKQGAKHVSEALGMFDATWPHLLADWHALRDSTDGRALTWLNDMPDAMANLLNLRLPPRERIPVLESALAAARQLQHRRAEGAHLGSLGLAHADLGEPRQALDYYARRLVIAQETGDRLGVGNSLHNSGLAYADLGEPQRAIEYFMQALEVRREIGERRGESQTLNHLGMVYQDLGATKQALNYHEQALVIARESGDRLGEGAALSSLGVAYVSLGQTRQAIGCHEQALAIMQEIGYRRGEGQALRNLGRAYQALGELRRAIEYYEQHLAIAREIGQRQTEVRALESLARLYYSLGDAGRATSYYEQALALAREIGDPQQATNLLGHLGTLYADLGQVDAAIQHFEQALADRQYITDRRTESAWLGNLGLAYVDSGQPDRALIYHEQALAISRELGDRATEGEHLGNLGRAYADLGDLRRATTFYQRALETAREIKDRFREGYHLLNLGRAYVGLDRSREAIALLEQALVINRELGDARRQAHSLIGLASAHLALQENERALEWGEQALAITRGSGYQLGEADALGLISVVRAAAGDWPRAIEALLQARELYQTLQSPKAEGIQDWLQARLAAAGPETRAAVVRALGAAAGGEPVYDLAIVVLEDPDPLVRAAAVQVLGQWAPADPNVLAHLLKCLADADATVQEVAAAALAPLAATHPAVAGALLQRADRLRPPDPITLTRRFLEAAGFQLQELGQADAVACIPDPARWNGQVRLEKPIYTRFFLNQTLDNDAVNRIREEARRESDFDTLFVAVSQAPSASGLLAIATQAAAGIRIALIDSSLVQRGREQQREHEVLESELAKILGRRRNPYSQTTPVSGVLHFFGRARRGHELLEYLSAGNPVALFGWRKTGKTSLLYYLRDEADFPVAYVDLQASRDVQGLYRKILESWQQAARVKRPKLAWEPPAVADSGGFRQATDDLMAQLEAQGYGRQLGLLLDEIEIITPKKETDNPPDELARYLEIGRTIRALIQETGTLAFLLTGVDARVIRINRFDGEQNPFYVFLRPEYLEPLNRQDTIEMIQNIGSQVGISYEGDAAGLIAGIGGGHPFVTRQLCAMIVDDLWERAGDDALADQRGLHHTVSVEDVLSFAERYISDPATAPSLAALWQDVTDPLLWPRLQALENEAILKALAHDRAQSEGQLLAATERRPVRTQSLLELKKRAVLSPAELADLLRIRMTLFQDWIRQEQLQEY